MDPAKFRAERKRLGYSQAHLAKVLGLSLRQIVAWERGEAPIRPMVRLAMAKLSDIQERWHRSGVA